MVSKLLIVAYVLVCLIATIANGCDYSFLVLLTKPLIVPIIYLYYFVECKKVNFYFSVLMGLFFIGESAIILDLQDQLLFIMIPFFLAYLVLIKLGFEEVVRFKYSLLNIISLVIVFSMLFFVFYSLVEILSLDLQEYKIPFAIYSFVLFFLAMIAAYNIIYKINLINLFFTILVTCFVVSDVFFIIYSFYSKTVLLGVINYLMQMISYYILVKYILEKDKIRFE